MTPQFFGISNWKVSVIINRYRKTVSKANLERKRVGIYFGHVNFEISI